MRILFIAHEKPEYLQDLVFHGLVELLGEENVIDFPPQEHYRSAPPERHGRPMLFRQLSSRHDGDLPDLVEASDAIVIGCALREDVLEHVRRVLELRRSKPVVYLDGEDDPYVRGIIDYVDLYFKRDTYQSAWSLRARTVVRRLYHAYAHRDLSRDPLRRQLGVATPRNEKVVPLPYGVVDVGFSPVGEQRFDVAFLGTIWGSARAGLVAGLRELERSGCRVLLPDEDHRRVTWREYIDGLSSSRIAVSVRGFGLDERRSTSAHLSHLEIPRVSFDTYRYWEIPYSGALLVAEPPPILIPGNFVHGKEAVFAPLDRIPATVERLLADSDIEAMAKRGREKLMSRHTSVHRAATVLESLERLVSERQGRRTLASSI